MTSKVKVNTVETESGSTLTLGKSGDTVTLASGASQSGFGRTGTVNWDTTVKTAAFTAVSGNGYFVNTTSGAITVTLPASPSAGDIVAVKDYANTADTNNITIGRNGSNIDGAANDVAVGNEGGSVTLIYVDATKGWLVTDAAQKSDIVVPDYIAATGGTITTCGNFKIHTFTSPGTFTVTNLGNTAGSETVDYMVVAGGGGGAVSCAAGGGGAGGFRESSGAASGCYTASPLGACVSALPVSVTGYPITVGGGGAAAPGSPRQQQGSDGSNSVFSTITATGGGGGGGAPCTGCQEDGRPGGSGGGGSHSGGTGGSGNTPPVAPPQGNNGRNFTTPIANDDAGGGGGGATSAADTENEGGTGATTSISGSATAYAGGGGGAARGQPACYSTAGGTGGGGRGGYGPRPAPVPQASGVAGTTNTGGGGGGATRYDFPAVYGNGAAGGSGIVIIRYRFQ